MIPLSQDDCQRPRRRTRLGAWRPPWCGSFWPSRFWSPANPLECSNDLYREVGPLLGVHTSSPIGGMRYGYPPGEVGSPVFLSHSNWALGPNRIFRPSAGLLLVGSEHRPPSLTPLCGIRINRPSNGFDQNSVLFVANIPSHRPAAVRGWTGSIAVVSPFSFPTMKANSAWPLGSSAPPPLACGTPPFCTSPGFRPKGEVQLGGGGHGD